MAVIAIFKYQIKPGRLPDFHGQARRGRRSQIIIEQPQMGELPSCGARLPAPTSSRT
jgi:hypothetical protein